MTSETELQTLKDKMWKRSYFVMFRKIVHPERIPNVLLEHYQWIIALEKQGEVFASGPLFDSSEKQGVGMTVFRTDTRERATELAAQDPFVSSGAVEFEIHRWQINEGRVNISVDFSDQTFTAS